MIGFINNEVITTEEIALFKDIKPILRPLSDLNKEQMTYTVGFSEFNQKQIDEIIRMPLLSRYPVMEKLFEYHFDVFNLLDKNLAITR